MSPAAPALVAILAFNGNTQLAVRRLGSKAGLPFTGTDLAMATARLGSSFADHTPALKCFQAEAGGRAYQVFLTRVDGVAADREVAFQSLDTLVATPTSLAPSLAVMLGKLEPHLVDVPYLHLGENDFIYKFRPAQERNAGIYA